MLLKKKILEQFVESRNSLSFSSPFDLFSHLTNIQLTETGSPPRTTSELQDEWKKLPRGRKKDYEDLLNSIEEEIKNKNKASLAEKSSRKKNKKKLRSIEGSNNILDTSFAEIPDASNAKQNSTIAFEMAEAKEARSLRNEVEMRTYLASRVGTFDTEFMSGYPTMKTPMLHFI